MPKVKRALISVSDKTGVVEFAKALAEMGVEIISTGGTAKALSDAGIKVTGISEVTGFPEMMEGRVKTLHPAVHGGLLADRSKPDHMRQIEEQGIRPIDLVAVNLYPFARTVARPDVTLEDAIENIDIGGPSMVRSASKNFASVTIVVDPSDYDSVLQELRANEGEVSCDTRAGLATKAFTHTAAYDTMISSYLQGKFMPEEAFPAWIDLRFEKTQELRYGENPHQKGAFYKTPGYSGPGIASAKQLSGKELSYNNIWDSNAALELVKEFEGTAAAIIKHTNPCGVALGDPVADSVPSAPQERPRPVQARPRPPATHRCAADRLATACRHRARRVPTDCVDADDVGPCALRVVIGSAPSVGRGSTPGRDCARRARAQSPGTDATRRRQCGRCPPRRTGRAGSGSCRRPPSGRAAPPGVSRHAHSDRWVSRTRARARPASRRSSAAPAAAAPAAGLRRRRCMGDPMTRWQMIARPIEACKRSLYVILPKIIGGCA